MHDIGKKIIKLVEPPFVSFSNHLLVNFVFVIEIFFFFLFFFVFGNHIYEIICGYNITLKNNRDSVDVGSYCRTTLKLLSSFFCLPSFFTKECYNFNPWIICHQIVRTYVFHLLRTYVNILCNWLIL